MGVLALAEVGGVEGTISTTEADLDPLVQFLTFLESHAVAGTVSRLSSFFCDYPADL